MECCSADIEEYFVTLQFLEVFPNFELGRKLLKIFSRKNKGQGNIQSYVTNKKLTS